MELRCSSRLYGILREEGFLEVKCSSKFCGAGKGVVVLHYFDLSTGRLANTKRYLDPASKFVRQRNTAMKKYA